MDIDNKKYVMSKLIIPSTQRALVFQGGVALGAYEAGVFKGLYDRLYKPDQPFFDIVAGTSAGAINAAILVSYVKEHKKWDGSADKLIDFWKHLSSPTPFIAKSYEYALGESARRYYSTKHFFYEGANNVFSAPRILPDTRFHDYQPTFNFKLNVNPNTGFVYSNEWLKQSLEHYYYKDGKKFVKFPLATKYDNGEPRLLVISVDVLDGAAVAFDSYSNESKYGRYDEESEQYQEHTIRYEKGIMPIHVMASGAFPVYFNFRWVPKDYDYNNAGGEESEEFGFREDSRPFWDGGVLSNTPLRELISEHKLFWEKRIGDTKLKKDMWKGEEEREEDDSQKVPGLEVFIVNVWPKRETRIPSDHDEVKDRKNDIAYCDKTEYDQKVAVLVSDYIEIIRQMRNFSLDYIPQNKQNNFKDKLDEFLERQHAESKNRKGEPRTYEELLKGRFKITSVATIERTDDVNDISNKWADFSEDSIIRLINKGIEDAKRVHIV